MGTDAGDRPRRYHRLMVDTATAPRRPATGRKLALFLGLACVAGLGGAAVLRWPELQRAWYLARLRREPSFFNEALSSSHPPIREACRRYVHEPRGGRQLVQVFLREIDSCAWSTGRPRTSSVLEPLLQTSTDHMALALRTDSSGHSYTCMSWRGKDGHSSFSMTAQPAHKEKRDFLLELLSGPAGNGYRLSWPFATRFGADGPDLEVHLASTAAIRAATEAAGGDDTAYLRKLGWPPLWGLGGLPSSAEHVCLIRKAP